MARRHQTATPAALPGAARLARPSGWRVFTTLLAKDLRQEFRTKDMITSMGIYALLVLIIYGVAFGNSIQSADMAKIAGGLLWALVVFTSLLGLNRSFAYEAEGGCLDALLLVPMDRGCIYLAKMCANIVFLAAVEIISVPVFWFLFLVDAHLGAQAWLVVVPLLFGTIGIAGVGTLMSTITIHARGRDVLLAVLMVPLIFPLLYACVSATSAVITGATDWQNTLKIGLALSGGYDIIMILVSWVLYDAAVSV